MKWTIICSAILTMASISTARADWQYTKWGMTPAEVAKASKGQAMANPKEASESTEVEFAKLTAPYTAGEFMFEAKFMFNRGTDKLSGVRLDLIHYASCNSLRSELLAKYDTPMKDSWSGGLKVTTWQDRPSNMRIQILAIGETSCQIIYAPLASASNKGL
jgi:hypothetical protein